MSSTVKFSLLISIICSAVLISSATAQKVSINGKVTSEKSGEPIAGANLVVRSLLVGTATNVKGEFILRVPTNKYDGSQKVTITHIAYARYETTLDELRSSGNVKLASTVIRSPELEIVGRRQTRAANDLPASVSTIDLTESPVGALSDIGLVLARESSLYVDQSFNGEKTVSIRGSNSDEVLILYDGIPLNSGNRNSFDLSNLSLDDVERIDIVKGSNTSIFGMGIFGGVINIIPRTVSSRTFRLNARSGTYDTKDVAFQAYKSIHNFSGSYKFSKKETNKSIGSGADAIELPNDYSFHNATAKYSEGNHEIKLTGNLTFSDYLEPLTLNKRDNTFGSAGLSIATPFLFLNDMRVSGLFRRGEQSSSYDDPRGIEIYYTEKVEDNGWTFRIEDREINGNWDFYFAMDRIVTKFNGLATVDNRSLGVVYPNDSRLSRYENGAVAIAKMHGPIESDFFQYIDWDFSMRYYYASTDRLKDDLQGLRTVGSDKHKGLLYKTGFKTGGTSGNSRYYLFLSNGNNVRLPTLRHLFNLDVTHYENWQSTVLLPEENISTEIGGHFEFRDPNNEDYLSEYGIHIAYFRNNYLNKIVEWQFINPPPVPGNTGKNSTRGWDFQLDVSIYKDLLSLNLGALLLNIENPGVFLYKPNKKFTSTATLYYKRFQISSTYFYVGEQVAYYYIPGMPLEEGTLDARTDVDLHLKRKFHLGGVDLTVSISGLNLKNSGAESAEFYANIITGRQWYGGLSFAF